MTCRSGSCDVEGAVGRVALNVSLEQRAEALASCYIARDKCLKAGDEDGVRKWQTEINRIEQRPQKEDSC